MLEGEIKFHDVIGTDDPDLSDFRKQGAKLITYHGLADELIFPRGTYNYYNRVTEREAVCVPVESRWPSPVRQ